MTPAPSSFGVDAYPEPRLLDVGSASDTAIVGIMRASLGKEIDPREPLSLRQGKGSIVACVVARISGLSKIVEEADRAAQGGKPLDCEDIRHLSRYIHDLARCSGSEGSLLATLGNRLVIVERKPIKSCGLEWMKSVDPFAWLTLNGSGRRHQVTEAVAPHVFAAAERVHGRSIVPTHRQLVKLALRVKPGL